jgi:hypothetical protein
VLWADGGSLWELWRAAGTFELGVPFCYPGACGAGDDGDGFGGADVCGTVTMGEPAMLENVAGTVVMDI